MFIHLSDCSYQVDSERYEDAFSLPDEIPIANETVPGDNLRINCLKKCTRNDDCRSFAINAALDINNCLLFEIYYIQVHVMQSAPNWVYYKVVNSL